MPRLLTRQLDVDLDDIARKLLIGQPVPAEVILELYRWVAVTATRSGRRWRESDPSKWRRFPGIINELGLVGRWVEYPLVTSSNFELGFHRSSYEFMPKIRDVLTRLAFGDAEQLRRWRRIHGVRKCTIECRVLTRRASRWRNPLTVTSLGARGSRLNVSYNSVHKRARRLYGFVLVPDEDGWYLKVVYGVGEPKRGPVSAWDAYDDSCYVRPATPERARIPRQSPDESVSEFLARVRDFAESVVAE